MLPPCNAKAPIATPPFCVAFQPPASKISARAPTPIATDGPATCVPKPTAVLKES